MKLWLTQNLPACMRLTWKLWFTQNLPPHMPLIWKVWFTQNLPPCMLLIWKVQYNRNLAPRMSEFDFCQHSCAWVESCVCTYVCACMYVYMYVCIYIYIRHKNCYIYSVNMHTHAYISQVWECIHTHIHVVTYVHTYVCVLWPQCFLLCFKHWFDERIWVHLTFDVASESLESVRVYACVCLYECM
jgi:hypothetical protein